MQGIGVGKEKKVSFSYQLYKILWKSLDQVFPPECSGCHRKGYRWCPECQAKVEIIGSRVCPICGNPQNQTTKCNNCKQSEPPYRGLRSWAIFKSPLREALHQLKYRKNLGLGESLAEPLVGILSDLKWQIDLVVPVPLSKARLKERGYNQAALLARPVSMALSLPYSDSGLLRIKESRSQVGLSIDDRKRNVEDVFSSVSKVVANRQVLIVDDVTTTGATIEACARAVIASGASKVYGITLARAVLGSHLAVS